jgi:hypothetical protein
MLKKGDIVSIHKRINNIDWVDKPDVIIIEDVIKLGMQWVVAEINGSYRHSDGYICSTFLLENLEIDLIETRNNTIDKLLE